jgi:cellobiose phosphorylase
MTNQPGTINPAGHSGRTQSNKAAKPAAGGSAFAREQELDQYFTFRDDAKEVEFKRHDMPTPWLNYLSNGTFHTMLSHAGGGLAFYKSPQIWRITRYRFFHLPTDRSGPYIYLQDAGTGSYWCPTYEPAFQKPQEWKSSHGMGYTRFEAAQDEVSAKTVYFVGPFENSLIWNLTLTNHSTEVKELNVYAYAEFGMMEFMRELQWQCYNKHQVSVQYHDKEALIYKYGVENQPKPDETPLVYMMSDAPLAGYDGDRGGIHRQLPQ